MRTFFRDRASPQIPDDFDGLLDARGVRAVFQPIVDLHSGHTLGYEALVRGPVGSRYESPSALFAAARESGRVLELDWVCRAAAFAAAIEAKLYPSLSLFVKSEPSSLGSPCPDDLQGIITTARNRLRVFIEVNERAVIADPAGLLAAVAHAREALWGVALCDVGAAPASLAVMPFVHPDVIKLGLPLIQGRTTAEVARIVNAVLAQTERTGAAILAEGVEGPVHAEVAHAMGATLGQGWLYGRPDPLPRKVRSQRRSIRLLPPSRPVDAPTPYELVAAHREPVRATKEVLLPMSMHLEYQCLDAVDPPVVMACFQESRHFTPATRERFVRLATRAAFVGAVGVGMPTAPVPGVRGGELADDDPLRGEWDVIVIGPHFAGALVARDRGDGGPDHRRRFDAIITYDRELVIQAAQALLVKLVPMTASGAGSLDRMVS